VDPVRYQSSALEATVALATTAFIVVTAGLSIAAYRRRGTASGVIGSTLLGPGIRGWYFENLRPFEQWCVDHHVPAAYLSYAQLVGGALVGACYAAGMLFTGGWLLLFTGTLDIIDGQVARQTGGASSRGAFLDSVIDRYVESLVYFGLAACFRASWVLWAVLFALLGSTMVSYARARAEGLGADMRVGVFQRPERIVILGFGTILAGLFEHLVGTWLPGPAYGFAAVTITAIAVLTNLTALQRIISTWRTLGSVRVAATAAVGIAAIATSRDAAGGPAAGEGTLSPPPLSGTAKRVAGVFGLMLGAGLILDTEADWLGTIVLCLAASLFVAGLLDLRLRPAAPRAEDVRVSHPLGSDR
jgi:phosphatidylglycerophosphate synthase